MKRMIAVGLVLALMVSLVGATGCFSQRRFRLAIPTALEQETFNHWYKTREPVNEDAPKEETLNDRQRGKSVKPIRILEPQVPGYRWSLIEPPNHNVQAGKDLLLADERGFNVEYFFVQSLYRAVLEEMLYRELGLAGYEYLLKREGVRAGEVMDAPEFTEENRVGGHPIWMHYWDYRASYSTWPCQYFFLRNNLYVERLSKEQIDLLKGAISGGTAVVTDEIRRLVQDTYPMVTRFFTPEEVAEMNIEKGQVRNRFFSPTPACPDLENESLVLYLYYEPESSADERAGEAEEEWFAELAERMSQRFSGKLGFSVQVVPRWILSEECCIVVRAE